LIKHTQTYFYGGFEEGKIRGNCWQTAIASVLELPMEAVPHFVQFHEDGIIDWWKFTVDWAWYRGYQMFVFDRHLYTNEEYLVTGKSPRGDFHHVVVYRNGKMVHDPHPSGAGVLTEESMTVFRQR